MYIHGLREIKHLIIYAMLDRLIREAVEPLLDLLSEHTDRPELVLETLIQAIRMRTSIKNAIEETKLQDGQDPLDEKSWQHIITRTFRKIDVGKVEETINRILARQTETAKNYGLLGRVLIVDQKEKPAWHRVHTEYIVSINPKKKPHHKGHRFYIGAIAGKITVINSYIIDGGDIDKETVVGRALVAARKFVEIRRTIIDAGFFKEGVYSAVKHHESDILGAVPKNSKVVRIIMDHHRALSHHYEPGIYLYRLGNVTFHLLVVPRPKEKRKISNDHDVRRIVKNYVSLAVFEVPRGIPDEFRTRSGKGIAQLFREWAFRIAEDYQKRGLIEVLLRLESLIGARIGAHYASLRFFIFGLELVITNIYSLLDGFLRHILLLSHSLSVRIVAMCVIRYFRRAIIRSNLSRLDWCFRPISTRPPPMLD